MYVRLKCITIFLKMQKQYRVGMQENQRINIKTCLNVLLEMLREKDCH